MIIDLHGKRAVVTGSTKGIGLAVAEGLARAGARVTVVGRTRANVDKAVGTLVTAISSEHIQGVAADLSTSQGAQTLLDAVPHADILVNNLGIYSAKPVFELDDADWQTMFDVNVFSAARLSKHYAPQMKAQGWGRLIFISSESAQNIPVEMVHYGVSKAAMQALSRGWAKALAGTGVTSNAVLPGPTRTENAGAFLTNFARQHGFTGTPEEIEARFLAQNRPSSLLGRFASPQEVASLCVYVASPQASATTGAALRVEGGIIESPGS